jgi:VWFA-related protein
MKIRAALAGMLISVAMMGASAQKFTSSVEAVRVDVLVTMRGVPVQGLRTADFEVRDNGVLQSAELIGFEQMPVNVVMALDLSASVDGPRLADLRRAGGALLGGLRPEEHSALLTFSHVVTRRTGLTRDRRVVIAALESAEPRGDTSLIDAAYSAMLVAEAEASRALVVVFSDGVDVSSWLPPQRVLDTAKRLDAVVYGVSTRGTRPRFLEDLTEQTGGRLLDVESKKLSETFVGILDEFRSRYVLSYSPRGVKPGGWHQLDVRVKGRRATVKARPGYLAGH